MINPDVLKEMIDVAGRVKMRGLNGDHYIDPFDLATLARGVLLLTKEHQEGKVRAQSDNPDYSDDDFTHPAWWRGNDQGVWATIDVINKILDNGRDGGTFGSKKLEALANRLTSLRESAPQNEAERELLQQYRLTNTG